MKEKKSNAKKGSKTKESTKNSDLLVENQLPPTQNKTKKKKPKEDKKKTEKPKGKESIFIRYFGKKVGKARVRPVSLKIVLMFTLFLFLSNILTNYISYVLYKNIHVKQLNDQMVTDLETMYNSSNLHYRQYSADTDYNRAQKSLQQSGFKLLKKHITDSNPRIKAFIAGVMDDGTIQFYASKTILEDFDIQAIEKMNQMRINDKRDSSSILFHINNRRYKAVYKWSSEWKSYIIVAEELNEFYWGMWKILALIGAIILAISLVFMFIGNASLRYILRYIPHITQGIMKMQETGELTTINMDKAPNDDVSYLGISLNALIVMVDNLMNIFRRFATTDVVRKAYRELDVKLEGEQKELTMLFTDIRSFTYRTETLGADIIRLLNMHYEKAIEKIHFNHGIIGSIIGDALLAVYGTVEEETNKIKLDDNKSFQALRSAYEIQKVAAKLRELMTERREELIKKRKSLSPDEEDLYQAVMIEVGVGLDKGKVFYGNIGSTRRMTNTVIGDRVNSASRLEGLTRFYEVPVIVSDEIREEVIEATDSYHFLELDQVKVKGKTQGLRVFWPIPIEDIDAPFEREMEIYLTALKAYYEGKWTEAKKLFKKCKLPCATIFTTRLKGAKVPSDWNGVWQMESK